MKLTKDEIDYIQSVIKTANLVGIGNIIIEPGKIRAMDEDQTVVLFQDKNVPEMSFGSIGLNRISLFLSRLTLALSQDKFEIEAITAGEDSKYSFSMFDPADKKQPMWVRSLTMSGKNVKIDYRCASPQTIKAPKIRAGQGVHKIDLTPDAVDMISKGKSAMKTDDVSFHGNKDGVILEIADINGDSLEYHFSDIVHLLGTGTSPDFSYKYPIELLLPIFKTNPTGSFSLTGKGTLVFPVNGLDIYVMCKS